MNRWKCFRVLAEPVDDVAVRRSDAARARPVLERILGALKPRDRSVLILFAVEGLSYQEIANVLGLSAQTVANHMSLAMADLRTTLKPYLSHREAGDTDSQNGGLDREQMDG